MTINVPISPHLQAFVRAQLASGRFQSESDIISAALALLEEFADSDAIPAGRRSQRQAGQLQAPSSKEIRAGATQPQDSDHTLVRKTATTASTRRSPRGLLADIASHISAEEIEEARNEMWGNFPHRETW